MVKAVDIYTDMGRFTVAAKHHQTIAEIYETDVADLEKAMHHYEQVRRRNAHNILATFTETRDMTNL